MRRLLARQLLSLALCPGVRCECTATALERAERVVGSYTSHTKKLWLARLLREKTADANAPLPQPQEKEPVVSQVNYPFSTDPVLKEEVTHSNYASSTL